MCCSCMAFCTCSATMTRRPPSASACTRVRTPSWPASAGDQHTVARARSSGWASSVRLLFLTPQFPFPPTQGAAIRNSHLIAGLAARHEVGLLTFASVDMSARAWAELSVPDIPGTPPLAQLTVIPAPHRSTQDRLHTLLRTPLPDMARRLASPAFAAALRQVLEHAEYDWVILEGIEMAPHRHAIRGRWLYDAHNAEYLLQQRAFQSDLRAAYRPRALAGAIYSLAQWRRLIRYEARVCRDAAAVTAVSTADRDALQRLAPEVPVSVVPNGVDLALWAPDATPADQAVTTILAAGPLLVFDGSMDFRPNIDAVRWFCAECWPRIRAAHPAATFAIVGRNPTAAVRALSEQPGVRVTGAVPDTRPWVAGATVYVVPMRIGGGVRLKLLQALAMGRPVVSTPMGAEGVDLTDGRDLLLAAGAAEFAAAVNALIDDADRRTELGAAARAAVGAYAWEHIVPRFEAVLEGQQRSGPRVQTSLVMTVRNEAPSIGAVLHSIAEQVRPPDELVIADGGSTDGTLEAITAAAATLPFPVRLLRVPGANISAGRNAAIRATEHSIVAATDAGVRLPPGWLAALIAPFEAIGGAAVDVAAGFFAADPQSVFERAMGATVLPVLADVQPETFLPSSRSVAFRKEAWAAVGGYPEWLDYSEDLVFDLALKARGCRFVFVPDAVALFRPRGSLRALWRQYYLYARGDGKADLWRKRHAIRYATYLGAPLLAVAARHRPGLWL
ncbi:MAG TPA: glycosyltransferase, partial [Chloroflexia bacterium]|nr:glycosyltransferase [Chloroflexia bacterium]